MRPFDLEKAKAGEPVITRGGESVRIVCTDMKGNYNVVALKTEGRTVETVCLYTETGSYFTNDKIEHPDDLFMAPVKKEAWLNIYPDCMVNAHPTKEDAEMCAEIDRVACIKIDWEE
jgi:hypothetical protein